MAYPVSLRLLRTSSQAIKHRIIFVHGFLGSSHDWSDVVTYLPESIEAYAIDLPGHGVLADFTLTSFEQYAEFLLAQIKALPCDGTPLALVGYSLGARIIMHALNKMRRNHHSVQLIVLEGGNFGLQEQSDKKSRWQNDEKWANRFINEPIGAVLNDWYRQPVFCSLSEAQRSRLIVERSNNNGSALASVMLATSLGKQEYLLPRLKDAVWPIHFLVGEKDHKFNHLYTSSGVQFCVILGAGHNAHKEQPEKYVNKLTQLLPHKGSFSL